MALPAASGPSPHDTHLPPRRGNGCLYGCMALILILALPVVLVGSYGTWFLYRGLGHEPAVRLARELVARDGIARQVLGTPVEVTGIQANAWSWMPTS